MKRELLLTFICASCINALLAVHPSHIQTNDRLIPSTDPTSGIIRLNLIPPGKQRQLDLNAKCDKEVKYNGEKLLLKL
jgi:hypothetical protein